VAVAPAGRSAASYTTTGDTTQPRELGREFMSSLWNLSAWLNEGNKGLTIALILLAVIVNRILKRQH